VVLRTRRDAKKTAIFSRLKIQIVLEDLRGKNSCAGLCCKHCIHENNYYNWSKEFLEAGKKRLSGIPKAMLPDPK
jgi:transposase